MKSRLRLCLFLIVCLCNVLSDAVNAVTNNTNVSPSASLYATSNLTTTSSFVPVQPPNPQEDKNNAELAKRREFVVEMMKHAWDGYVKCAWGKGRFSPIACKGKGTADLHGTLASYIWEAMPTLWLMGLRDEFNRARKWIEQEDIAADMKLDRSRSLDTFVGSMLSCYALTGGDEFFLDRALNYTMLYWEVEKKENKSKHHSWSTTQLEMYYLTHLTGNQSYRQYAQDVEQAMEKYYKTLSSKIETINGNYLLIKAKQYVQSNYSDNRKRDALQIYSDIEQLQKEAVLKQTKLGLWYIENHYQPEQITSRTERLFHADLCNIGAALSLGAMLMPLAQYNVTSWRKLSVDQVSAVSAYWQLANNFTDTCYWASKLTSDYMIPFHGIIGTLLPDDTPVAYTEAFYVVKTDVDNIQESIKRYDNNYNEPTFNLDSYQVLESYFTLSRLTREQKYRDSAWQMANKLNQYSRYPNGYISAPKNKTRKATWDDDYQPPLFFTTLSYLYLMFTPDSYLPLEKWVLNSAGHPLPVCGSGNPAYPNVKC